MTWTAVAKKEYLENVRNAWVIAVSVVFLVLTLLTSAFTAAADQSTGLGLARIGPTLNLMDTFSGFMLPILALMLGFGTLAGERESGSLGLLLAQPIRRGEVLMGKWLGLFGVLATAILAGFGVGGIFVIARTGAAGDVNTLLVFLVESLAWGAAWVSITTFLSSWFNRRGTAIAGSIGAWFFFSTLVWQLLVFVVLVSTLGSRYRNLQALPNWLIVTQWLNPNTVYEGLASTTIEGFQGITSFLGRTALPDMWKAPYFGIAMALWIVLPFAGAWAIFHSKDV
ncbi:MAG: type transport system permease protein [Thermoplasmata archaeon]|jgi:Cu-processing system permease protein|nr:type transport system permease protein [Thermoplasmata archaeon]